jgi:hypothetical protein
LPSTTAVVGAGLGLDTGLGLEAGRLLGWHCQNHWLRYTQLLPVGQQVSGSVALALWPSWACDRPPHEDQVVACGAFVEQRCEWGFDFGLWFITAGAWHWAVVVMHAWGGAFGWLHVWHMLLFK